MRDRGSSRSRVWSAFWHLGALKLSRCHTHFFSLGAFEFDAASPRAVLVSDRLKSELPASASYEARPSSLRGIDF
jgi:hypothetical protein